LSADHPTSASSAGSPSGGTAPRPDPRGGGPPGEAPVEGRPGAVRVWLAALRVPTLAASVAPVLVGTALAARDGRYRAGPALAALLGALLIQTGTNLANDLFDFRKGADTKERIGPPRVLERGWLPVAAVRAAMAASFALAAVAGIYLTAVAGWPVVAIGLASIAAGILYTAGPWALAYHALGEVFVFLFFGLVAVGGTYFVQARTLGAETLLAAMPVGALATAILVANNVRDIETDRAAGKRTLAVALGGPARASSTSSSWARRSWRPSRPSRPGGPAGRSSSRSSRRPWGSARCGS
jgi:1,4-dihydroxy-2-naphthoate octaprenyltransferase